MAKNVRVRLVDHTKQPYNLSIAAARTCYSGRGIITPEDVSRDEKARALRDRIAQSTLRAGHLTTRQHVHFVFSIENVSRHLVWSMLHSHPYYNSEQVSQRYVEVKGEHFYVPRNIVAHPRHYNIYLQTVQNAIRLYEELIQDLLPVARKEYFRLFPGRARKPEKWESVIKKKAMESARYILPVSTHTYLYHTISALTLYRYKRMAGWFELPHEATELIGAMVDEVEKIDPLLVNEMPDELSPEESEEYRILERLDRTSTVLDPQRAKRFVSEFEETLEGKISRLVSRPENGTEAVASSLRATLGLSRSDLSDGDALRALLSPEESPLLASTLGEANLSRILRSLSAMSLVFQKKISHTADSQDQRHRTVPGARPVLMTHFTGEADFITPLILRESSIANERYQKGMSGLFEGINRLLHDGADPLEVAYLLPNAFPVRFLESGELLNLHHKWKTRSCYNAQEEIFRATIDEILQTEAAFPEIAGTILPPCFIRKEAGIRPPCPEGDRFCGVRVWELDPESYNRIL